MVSNENNKATIPMNNDKRDELIMEIHSAVHTLAGLIERHDKTLYGNGKPGLCTDVTELKLKAKWSSKWTLLLFGGISTIVGGTIGAVASVLVKRLIS